MRKNMYLIYDFSCPVCYWRLQFKYTHSRLLRKAPPPSQMDGHIDSFLLCRIGSDYTVSTVPNRRLWIMWPSRPLAASTTQPFVLTRCIDCCCWCWSWSCSWCAHLHLIDQFGCTGTAFSFRLLIASLPVNAVVATFHSSLCAFTRRKTVCHFLCILYFFSCSLGSLENLITKLYINQQSILVLLLLQHWFRCSTISFELSFFLLSMTTFVLFAYPFTAFPIFLYLFLPYLQKCW